jgi:hypothetical protein
VNVTARYYPQFFSIQQSIKPSTEAMTRQQHRILGDTSNEADQSRCFVLMPFRNEFDEIWQDVLRSIGDEFSLRVLRADDIYGSECHHP